MNGDLKNVYKPYVMKIDEIRDETPDTKTFKLVFKDEEEGKNFSFRVGQFGEYSAFGAGECTFCIASSPTREDYIECTFRKAGRVTTALQNLDVGDEIGFRGPLGNTFPVEEWEGKNIIFIAGGIALPPMRCVIWYVLDNRDKYKDVTIVYGARTIPDLVYKDELEEWEKRDDVDLWRCIDWKFGPEGILEEPQVEGWPPINLKEPAKTEVGTPPKKFTCFVPQMVEVAKPTPENSIAVVCGPPIMIKFTFPVLDKLGFEKKQVYTTLENRMKCGFGKCGRCNVGEVYVCKEGPVFTEEQLSKMPAEY